MDPREFRRSHAFRLLTLEDAEDVPCPPEVRVSFTLSVKDATALWHAAAARAIAMSGTELDDVIEMLGPREDPSIADCVAMLTVPSAIRGCDLEDFQID